MKQRETIASGRGWSLQTVAEFGETWLCLDSPSDRRIDRESIEVVLPEELATCIANAWRTRDAEYLKNNQHERDMIMDLFKRSDDKLFVEGVQKRLQDEKGISLSFGVVMTRLDWLVAAGDLCKDENCLYHKGGR